MTLDALIVPMFSILAAVAGQWSAPTKVAVVNVPEVSGRYDRTTDLEAKFELRRRAYQEKRDEMRDRLERNGRALQEQIKPGTVEFETRRKELVLLEAELNYFVETEGQQIEHELALSLLDIFRDIEQAVKAEAEAKGLDIVLAADQLPSEPPKASNQVRQQIVLQKVMYWRPEVDIPDDVVNRLNSTYASRKTNSGSATSGGK